MLSFSSKDIPDIKASVLLGLLLELNFLIFFGIAKLIGYNPPDITILIFVIGVVIMSSNFYLFTRNKFHRKNFTYFEKERLLRSFWKEELVYYLFISLWLLGLIIFTAIENPGFKR